MLDKTTIKVVLLRIEINNYVWFQQLIVYLFFVYDTLFFLDYILQHIVVQHHTTGITTTSWFWFCFVLFGRNLHGWLWLFLWKRGLLHVPGGGTTNRGRGGHGVGGTLHRKRRRYQDVIDF